MKEKQILKVFLIHQWVMADLQKYVINLLKSDSRYEIIDFSCSKTNPLTGIKEKFLDDSVCGIMMESDIVIVLPDTKKPFDYFGGEEDYISDFNDSFRRYRGLKRDSVYYAEIKSLMFDSCDIRPVLVLGWTKESADYLLNIIKHPKYIGNRRYNKHRFYAMGMDEIKEGANIIEKIIQILKNK